MVKDIWLNLPVQDIDKACTFYSSVGFTFNPNFPKTETMACLHIANKLVIMLFEQKKFVERNQIAVTDTKQNSEILLSFELKSPEEVDEIAKQAVSAGGVLFSSPSEQQGWMYGCGFTDLDGHRWNALYMDWSKAK